jgi:hypothetical protein
MPSKHAAGSDTNKDKRFCRHGVAAAFSARLIVDNGAVKRIEETPDLNSAPVDFWPFCTKGNQQLRALYLVSSHFEQNLKTVGGREDPRGKLPFIHRHWGKPVILAEEGGPTTIEKFESLSGCERCTVESQACFL